MTAKITINVPTESDASVDVNKAFAHEMTKEQKMDYLFKAKFAFEKYYNQNLKDYALEYGRTTAARRYGASDVQKVL